VEGSPCSTVALVAGLADAINAYDMSTIPWGKFLQINFSGCGPTGYTTTVNSTFGGFFSDFVNDWPSTAFSCFGTSLCDNEVDSFFFVRGQQMIYSGTSWNIQTPPWCWIESAGPVPVVANVNPLDAPQIDGPGTLTCTDSSDGSPVCLVNVPIPATWSDIGTIANNPGAGQTCWNFLYSILTIGSLCDDPP
jgi:hypothetical protein